MSDQIDLFGGNGSGTGNGDGGDIVVSSRTTIGQARMWLFSQRSKGTNCPCCSRVIKLYPRQINGSMAAGLMIINRALQNSGDVWVFLPKLIPNVTVNSQLGYLKHWDLIHKRPGDRKDGSNRNGWWGITERGRAYAEGTLTLPHYALIYLNRLEGYRGQEHGISKALGVKYNHREMMEMPIDGLHTVLEEIEQERLEKAAKRKAKKNDDGDQTDE